ncbi:MAG TPA: DNA-formamidopyrimidine glycosylase [Firmicutes bacterium]|nr:DNA-formamidopyrimidine glycosylase [Bacillota bacterium]
MMPEIAEVETVRNTLKKRILNKPIKSVNVRYTKMIESNLEEFKKVLIGRSFLDIKRRGKWLIFDLGDYYLLSHLRMEGKYFIKNHEEELNKHEHVIITFTDNTDLRYHDTRKFGRMNLIKKEELATAEEIAKQGLEPGDENLTAKYLIDKFKKKRLPIKTVLLDQTIISGLGNIYANEVLFAAGIDPLKKACDVSLEEASRIVEESNRIIKAAIKMGGTTIKSYTSSLGVTGRFQQYLCVHKREGMPCLKCGTTILNMKVNGRSTYFCPKCQEVTEVNECRV